MHKPCDKPIALHFEKKKFGGSFVSALSLALSVANPFPIVAKQFKSISKLDSGKTLVDTDVTSILMFI